MKILLLLLASILEEFREVNNHNYTLFSEFLNELSNELTEKESTAATHSVNNIAYDLGVIFGILKKRGEPILEKYAVQMTSISESEDLGTAFKAGIESLNWAFKKGVSSCDDNNEMTITPEA